MVKSVETVDCGTSKVPAWIISNGKKMIFDRAACIDDDGCVALAQMRDDECVIAPNAIYRMAK